MTKDKTKKFFRFLKELGLYRQFIQYTDKNYDFHHKKNFKEYCQVKPYGCVISDAFHWVGTPQGDPFWRRIAKCWQEDEGIITNSLRKRLKKLDMSKTFK